MYWYWILLIIFGYFVIGAIIVGLMVRYDYNDELKDGEGFLAFTAVLWPLALVVLMLCGIGHFVSVVGKNKPEENKQKNKKVKDL